MSIVMPARRTSPTRLVSPQRFKCGFTLLEVIIAMSLVSILMVLVWSLFSTYTRLETRSSRAATELQLVRSISRQLTSDLEHFAVLPSSPNVVLEKGSRDAGDEPAVADPNDGEDESDATQNADVEDIDSSVGESLGDGDSSSAGDIPASDEDIGVGSIGGGGGGVSLDEVSDLGVAGLLETGQVNAEAGVVTSSLPAVTYLRGSATRLEFVTRLPYTVDVPTGLEIIGAETKYGTHQLVLYEWRGENDLESLLQNDPVLNPSKWNPPPAAPAAGVGTTGAATDSTAATEQPAVAPPLPTRLNPNDNVGLIRETKSWLQATRDRQRTLMLGQAANAGMLLDGGLPNGDATLVDELGNLSPSAPLDVTSDLQGNSMGDELMSWHPPPELRHRRDHLPEITRWQFRYFDGKAWELSWTRDDRLPVAVEIAFDLDPNAPAAREKEYLAVHEAMLGGKSINEVLPQDDLDEAEMPDEIDPLATLNLDDPGQIVTEYRFVILLPKGAGKGDTEDDARIGRQRSDNAAALGTETFSAEPFNMQSFGSEVVEGGSR